ncbi:nuclear poly(A) polymerase 3 isoform X2 [Senna tora]|uniref:Nuclear poly(A) polymerase 3 isoform X2 n=1 Tax=Senna tora TaxID=362788 RepID=A0A834TFZ3_9FABA|nr:nuclear poly(A) polymerase 3 isoform X2 [Senna tora]
MAMHQLMVDEGLVPSAGWEMRRKLVIQKLNSQSKSGIDALYFDPFFTSMVEDIFKDLHETLDRRPKISDIHCAKKAKVPLTQFKFDGVSVDLPSARLKERSLALHQLKVGEGLVPSTGWEMRKKLVIQKLK